MTERIHFAVTQGDTWTVQLQQVDPDGEPVNVAGWSLLMQIRTTPADDPDSVVVAELSPGAGITVDTAGQGLLTLTLPAHVTDQIRPGQYSYDLITGGAKPVAGIFTVHPGITRPIEEEEGGS